MAQEQTQSSASVGHKRLRAFVLGLLMIGITALLGLRSLSSQGIIYSNRDLSTGDLSQWTHRDFGLGTDVGGNESGAGYLWYHRNVAGRPAAGLTVTPNANFNIDSNSDTIYLWDPAQHWNYQPFEIWLRASVLFPSAATIVLRGNLGELPFQPTTGEWNWLLEFHNDTNPLPPCAKEFPNVALTVKTDDLVEIGVVGTRSMLAIPANCSTLVRSRGRLAPNITNCF